MLYSSLLFIYIFLPVSILLYYVTPSKHREKTLLILSIIFCGMINLWFLGFMLVYVAVNYIAMRTIDKFSERKEIASIPFAAAVCFDLTAILIFRTKYFVSLLSSIGVPNGFFPLGISFFTLSAIGTLIDVYTGKMKSDKNVLRFALYIIFFPRLIMGPVMRYGSFNKAVRERKDGLYEMGVGFTIFVKGLAKKIIAADNLYMLYTAVGRVDYGELSALTAWIGITAYILCLYFTLSGFSDMGVGISYCFGVRLPKSFSYPMSSNKIRYFAARWHTNVTHWFRRYVTRPLSRSIKNRYARQSVSIAVWGLFGFWYTFSMNGFIWGLLIGTAITIESRLDKRRIMVISGVIYTFLIAAVCTVFLAEESFSGAFRYLLAMLGGNRIFADTISLYLLKSYIVILLIGLYTSTSLFRNMLMRSGKNKLSTAFSILSPIAVTGILIVCTVMISYSGSSGMILMKL